jgi:hypothetical protein
VVRLLVMLSVAVVPVAAFLALMILATIRQRNIAKCRNCGMRKVRPSWPRGVLERALGKIGLTPYKCDGCLNRFYGWQN